MQRKNTITTKDKLKKRRKESLWDQGKKVQSAGNFVYNIFDMKTYIFASIDGGCSQYFFVGLIPPVSLPLNQAIC